MDRFYVYKKCECGEQIDAEVNLVEVISDDEQARHAEQMKCFDCREEIKFGRLERLISVIFE